MNINDLAKKYSVSSDELIVLLKNAGHDVESATSSVDYDMLSALDRHFSWATPTTKGKAKGKAKAKAKSKAKTATDAKAKAKAKTKTKAKAKTKTATDAKAKAKAKTKTKAKVSKKAAVADDVPEPRIRAKAKLIRKARPEPPPPPPEEIAEPEVEVASPKTEAVKAKTAPEKPVAEKKRRGVTPEDLIAAAAPVREREAKRPAKKRESEVAGKPAPATPARPDETKAPKPAAPVQKAAPAPPAQAERPTKAGRKKKGADTDAQQRAVAESVRRTLAKIDTTTRRTKRRKTKTEKSVDTELPPIQIEGTATVNSLAHSFGVSVDEILEHCEELGMVATPGSEVDAESIELIAEELGRLVEIEAAYGETRLLEEAQVDPARLVPRSPIVTVMGHVDHGKTSILDYIRKTRVADGEAGGITQHIGAYTVDTPGGSITFIDTPGHEAFTAMRARGANLTDIVVLVVAADDGVMPQTIEAINHTRSAGVPMVVAVNKTDLAGANPSQVKQQLMQYEVVVEEFGGEVVDVDVSAKTGAGIDKLLEMILLQAELLELKADPSTRAQGVVVEVKKEEGRGILVTLLVQQGTLNRGDAIVMGNEWAKVRSLVDYHGKPAKKAGASMPVLILGADGAPEAGDSFIAVKNEKEARDIAMKRQEAVRQRELQPVKALSLEALYEQIQKGEVKELGIVIKADTDGSAEALRDSLIAMEIEGIKTNVIHAAVGTVSESDVVLAQSADAIIVAFSTKVSPKAKELAAQKGVDIRAYKIIYEVIEDVDKALKGMLAPVFVERVLGKAEVRQLFKVSKLGTIAGSMVIEGSITRSANARVLRNGEVIHDGKITSLKRFQDDAKEVLENFECGIGVGYDDLVENDIIEAYVIEEKVRVF